MFGKKKAETNGSLVASNDIMLLDVTDLSSLVPLSTYISPKNANISGNTSNDNISNGQSDKQFADLSDGGIAGIAVGIVGLVCHK